MAFQDRYKRRFLAFYSYLFDSYPKNKKGRQKRSGSGKTNGIHHHSKNDSSKRKRERETIIRPEKKHKRWYIDQHRCLFLLFIYHYSEKNKYLSDNIFLNDYLGLTI
jgi:hypothetical protein